MGPEVILACGVALYLVALLLTMVKTPCGHECKPCRDEEFVRIKNREFDKIVREQDEHKIKHKMFRIDPNRCKYCKKYGPPDRY